MDEEALRAMMPMSFGKRGAKKTSKPAPPVTAPVVAEPVALSAPASSGKRRLEVEEDEEDDGLTAEERAANAAIEQRIAEQGYQSESDTDDDEDDIGPQPVHAPTVTLPPMTNESSFTGQHSKTLAALAVDQSGARFCVGSYDYSLSLYDFGGMNASLSPFRSFEPAETYPVYDVCFTSDSRNLLVVSGTAQAKIFSRDGADLGTCKKGDPYLRDMRNTTGHISDLSCGKCHPLDANTFITAGSDSTIRVWDLATMEREQSDMIVLKSKTRGNRTKVTSVQYSAEGRNIFGTGLDGSLHFWDTRANLNAKPRGTVEIAHVNGTVTSSIAVSGANSNQVATRGGDDTVKLWDLRKFKAPLSTIRDLANTSAHTEVIFDPFDGQSLLTCVSALPLDRNGNVSTTLGQGEEQEEAATTRTTGGKIVVLSTRSDQLEVVKSYSVSASSPVRLAWCAPTNQLFTTFRDGSLRIFYDSATSTKGITMAIARAPRDRQPWSNGQDADTLTQDQIYTPGADDAPQSESAKRRKLAKIRQDPLKSNMPQRPMDGPGRGGRIGTGANTHLTQSMYAQTDDQDPREALLKYADKES